MSIPKPPYSEGQEFTNDFTGVTYKFDGVKWIASSGNEEIDLSGYVRKEGGDTMQGPLVMRPQDGAAGRETNKVQTLGVFSNSDSSALRLGTTRDRVYIGHDDTSFNGPIKVDELYEKNANNGIKFSNTIKMKWNRITNLGDPVDGADAVTMEWVQGKIDELPAPSGFSVPVTFKCKGYLECSKSSPPPSGRFCIIYSGGSSTSANVWFGNCNHSVKVHYENFMSPEGLEISSGEEWNVSGYLTIIGDDNKTYLKAPVNKVRRNSGMAYVTIYFSSPVTTWGVGNVDDASSYMLLLEGYGSPNSTFAEDSEVE